MARIRLLIAIPGTGRSGDIVEFSREVAAAWVDAGRAEHVKGVAPAAVIEQPTQESEAPVQTSQSGFGDALVAAQAAEQHESASTGFADDVLAEPEAHDPPPAPPVAVKRTRRT